MPDEELRQRIALKLASENVMPLYIKSMIKLLVLLFAAIQFMNIQPFISLVILLLGYYTMPTKYRPDEPYKAMEAWVKILVGIMVAYMFYGILKGIVGWSLLNPVSFFTAFYDIFTGEMAASFFFLIMAFFIVLPKKEDNLPGQQKVVIQFASGAHKTMSGFTKGAGTEGLGKIIFLIFALLGGLPLLLSLSSGTMQWIFGIVWVLSLFMGWMSDRESRPYAGTLLLIVAIFVFSFQFTGQVGTAFFGEWWPTVEHYSSSVTEPMIDAFGAASEGIEDTYLLMTCPSCYYEKQRQRQEIQSGDINQGATKKSIEIIQFKAMNYEDAKPVIDPSMPLVGSIQLENQGDFVAENLKVEFGQITLFDPEEKSMVDEDQGINNVKSDCKFTTCSGTTTEEPDRDSPSLTCTYPEEVFQEDSKLLFFECGDESQTESKSSWSSDINSCVCVDTSCETDSSEESCREKMSCSEKDECNDVSHSMIFTNGGWWITIPVQYSFDYNSKVSIEAEVMNDEVYFEKFMNDELKPDETESKYSGGPVTTSVWLQEQPFRSGTDAYGRFSITNEGNKGDVIKSGAVMKLELPLTDSIDVISTENIESGCSFTESGEYSILECKTDEELGKDEYASIRFKFAYEVPEDVDIKSNLITGEVDYTYQKTEDIELETERFP